MSLGTSFNFVQLNEMACRYGHMLMVRTVKTATASCFQKGGVGSGNVVALLMDNGVHYVAAWLGCAKVILTLIYRRKHAFALARNRLETHN